MDRKPTREELMKEFAPLKKAVDAKRLPKNENTQDKVNKTVVDRARQSKEDESIEQLQEFKMIVAMAVSKKKENYNQLKRWDEKRSEMLAAHRNVIDELQLQLDKRIKASLENIEAYCSFFREKAKQEERYGQHSIIDPRLATQQNPIALQVYINCTSLLNVLGEHSQKEGERMLKFAATIKNDILKERLEQHHSRSTHSYQAQVKETC